MKRGGARFIAMYHRLIETHHEGLIRARNHCYSNEPEREKVTQEEYQRDEFLAHCGFATMLEAVNNTQVIATVKTMALLKIGDIFAVTGKYGVMFYLLPSTQPFCLINHFPCSLLDASEFLDAIGAYKETSNDECHTWNYSLSNTYLPIQKAA